MKTESFDTWDGHTLILQRMFLSRVDSISCVNLILYFSPQSTLNTITRETLILKYEFLIYHSYSMIPSYKLNLLKVALNEMVESCGWTKHLCHQPDALKDQSWDIRISKRDSLYCIAQGMRIGENSQIYSLAMGKTLDVCENQTKECGDSDLGMLGDIDWFV